MPPTKPNLLEIEELLHQIAIFVCANCQQDNRKTDLVACCLVSKLFSRVFSPFLWHDIDAEELCSSLDGETLYKNSSSIISLRIGKRGEYDLARLVCPRLTRLECDLVELHKDKVLFFFFQNGFSLKEVELQGVFIDRQILEVVYQLPNLQTLTVDHCGDVVFPPTSSHISTLRLRNVTCDLLVESDGGGISNAEKQSCRVETSDSVTALQIDHCTLSSHQIRPFIAHFPKIETLSLQDYVDAFSDVPNDAFHACPDLKHLVDVQVDYYYQDPVMGHPAAAGHALETIVSRFEGLETVGTHPMFRYHLTDEVQRALIAHHGSTLTTLRLPSAVWIYKKSGLMNPMATILSHLVRLEHLEISGDCMAEFLFSEDDLLWLRGDLAAPWETVPEWICQNTMRTFVVVVGGSDRVGGWEEGLCKAFEKAHFLCRQQNSTSSNSDTEHNSDNINPLMVWTSPSLPFSASSSSSSSSSSLSSDKLEQHKDGVSTAEPPYEMEPAFEYLARHFAACPHLQSVNTLARE